MCFCFLLTPSKLVWQKALVHGDVVRRWPFGGQFYVFPGHWSNANLGSTNRGTPKNRWMVFLENPVKRWIQNPQFVQWNCASFVAQKTKKGNLSTIIYYHRIVTNNQRLASISWCFNSISIFFNGISQPPLMTEDSPSDPGFTEPKLFSLRGGCARCWVHAMPWGSFAMSYMSCHHTKNHVPSGKLKEPCEPKTSLNLIVSMNMFYL